MIQLRHILPEGDQKLVFKESSFTVGRSRDCDLSRPEVRGLSRFHFRIERKGSGYRLEDLGSRNTTLVNGEVVVSLDLEEGDRIEAGKMVLIVEHLDHEEVTEEFVRPCLKCGHVFSARAQACPRCKTSSEQRGRRRSIEERTFPGYRLERKLGSGGMGIVFAAEDLASGERVALKVLRPHLAKNPAYLARFIEEIRLLTSLRHPGIVQVHGRGSDGELHWLVMELVAGKSAREHLRGAGALPWKRAVSIACEAARALNVAHQQAGIVHGDVKPGNILIDEGGRVKLCDFGLARVELSGPTRARGSGRALQETSSSAAEAERRGTAAYAAPERFGPEGLPTVSSDIYALGISLFQLLTGHLPFQGGNVSELRRAHRKGPIPRLVESNGPDHDGVQWILDRLLAKEVRRRPQGWPEVLNDLGLLLDG